MSEQQKEVTPRNVPRGRPAKYPWRTLAIGDSFFVSFDEIREVRGVRRIIPPYPGRSIDIVTESQRCLVGGVEGYRITRVK